MIRIGLILRLPTQHLAVHLLSFVELARTMLSHRHCEEGQPVLTRHALGCRFAWYYRALVVQRTLDLLRGISGHFGHDSAGTVALRQNSVD